MTKGKTGEASLGPNNAQPQPSAGVPGTLAPANAILNRLGYGLAGLIVFMSLPLPFFWDSILLGSEVGQHFVQNGLWAWILPPQLDSGHPPAFGWYLALWWTALGPTLPVAHLAMLPVLLLIWGSFYRLLRLLLPHASQQSAHWIGAGLLLLEPTFAAQAIHVGPDLVLLGLYLSALVCLLERRPAVLSLLLLAMGMTSLRGCLGMAALWVTAFALAWPAGASAGKKTDSRQPFRQPFRQLFRQPFRQHSRQPFRQLNWLLLPFGLAALGLVAWFSYHASQTGWVLANPDSAWSANQKWAGFEGILRNVGLIVWRLLDFGRLVLWVPGLLWMLTLWRAKEPIQRQERRMLLVFGIPLLVLSLAFLPFANPVAHRYFLVVFVLALPWFAYRIHLLDPTRSRFYGIAILSMLAFGHRWIYPDKVAQGWDASLAHLPYFSLMSQAWSEIPDPEAVYTEFPLYKPMQSVRPGSQQKRTSFKKAEGDWLSHDYVLYSNIINDIPHGTYDQITNTWPLQREWERGKVFIRLYRRPGMEPMELPELPNE